MDRMAALEKLVELTGGGTEQAEKLFRALEQSAGGEKNAEKQRQENGTPEDLG